MSRHGDTYLAVRSRQWVGGRLAEFSAWLMFAAAGLAWGSRLYASTTSPVSLVLWVGILALATLVSSPIYSPPDAIRTAEGHGRVGVRRAPQDREAARNLTRQLHARGRAGLFLRSVYARLGLGFVCSVLILVTVIFASDITTSGITASGWLPVVCLVCSPITLVGLLLAVPYGRREYVTVDATGQLRSGRAQEISPDGRRPSGDAEGT